MIFITKFFKRTEKEQQQKPNWHTHKKQMKCCLEHRDKQQNWCKAQTKLKQSNSKSVLMPNRLSVQVFFTDVYSFVSIDVRAKVGMNKTLWHNGHSDTYTRTQTQTFIRTSKRNAVVRTNKENIAEQNSRPPTFDMFNAHTQTFYTLIHGAVWQKVTDAILCDMVTDIRYEFYLSCHAV